MIRGPHPADQDIYFAVGIRPDLLGQLAQLCFSRALFEIEGLVFEVVQFARQAEGGGRGFFRGVGYSPPFYQCAIRHTLFLLHPHGLALITQ